MDKHFRTPWLSDVIDIIQQETVNRIVFGDKEFVLKEEKTPTVNIKDIPEPKMVKLVDLSEDSVNEIAEAVVRKIGEQMHWQVPYGGEVVLCEECKFCDSEDEYGIPYCSKWNDITSAYGFCHKARKRKRNKNELEQ